MRAAAALLLAACTRGEAEEGLLVDLMVFAVLTEPTRYVPGLPVSAEVTLANPDRIEVELLVWSCLANGRGACIGSDEAPLLSDPVVVAPAGLQTRVSLNDPAAALYDQARGAAPAGLQVWALACEVGACPIIGEVEAGEAAALRELGAPPDLLSTLPPGQSAMGLWVLPMADPGDPSTWTADPIDVAPLRPDGPLIVEPGARIDMLYSLAGLGDRSWYAEAEGVGGRVLSSGADESSADAIVLLAEAPTDRDYGYLYLVVVTADGAADVDLLPYQVDRR